MVDLGVEVEYKVRFTRANGDKRGFATGIEALPVTEQNVHKIVQDFSSLLLDYLEYKKTEELG